MPVSAVLRGVSASEIRLMAAYLAIEPAPEERIELAIAQLTALWAHSKKPQGSEYAGPGQFLMFRDAWTRGTAEDYGGLDENDMGVMNALHGR